MQCPNVHLQTDRPVENMLIQFQEQLEQGIYHESLGALYPSKQVAEMLGCEPATIRSQKKRQSDRGELTEGFHWVSGDIATGTLWTFEGLCHLGMAINSPIALQFRQSITDLLSRLKDGTLVILKTETGVTFQEQGVCLGGTGGRGDATAIATLPATLAPLPDPDAVADHVAQELHQRRLEAWETEVDAKVTAKLEQLSNTSERTLGERLGNKWGVTLP